MGIDIGFEFKLNGQEFKVIEINKRKIERTGYNDMRTFRET